MKRFDAVTTRVSRRRASRAPLAADKRWVRASLGRTGPVRTDAEARAMASVLAGREAAVAAARERGASLRAIAADFDVSPAAVKRALRRTDFAVAPEEIVRRRARGRSAGASYFETISDEARAYWLGFIAADGCLSQETRGVRFGVQLAERDRGHLDVLAASLELPVRRTPQRQGRNPIRQHGACARPSTSRNHRAQVVRRRDRLDLGAVPGAFTPALRPRTLRWGWLRVRQRQRRSRPRILGASTDARTAPGDGGGGARGRVE
jgi:hypothetical protein